MKRKVMQRAWQIAKQGAQTFGGKAREYFSVSLRLAWDELKKSFTMKKEVFAELPELSAVSDKQKNYAVDIRTAYLEKVKQALEEVQPTTATCKREVSRREVMMGFWNSKFWGLFVEFCKAFGAHSSDENIFSMYTYYNTEEKIHSLYDMNKKYGSIEEYNNYCKKVTEEAVSFTLEVFEKCVSVSAKAKIWISSLKYVLYR